MIVDKIENYKKYLGVNSGLKEGFEFLLNNNLAELAEGKHQIDGDRIFASVSTYQTKEHNESFPEKHEKYLDIQFVISGKEMMGYAKATSDMPVKIPYSKENDIAFFDYQTTKIPFENGDFFILFPEDLHQPALKFKESATVKKIVVKILVDTL